MAWIATKTRTRPFWPLWRWSWMTPVRSWLLGRCLSAKARWLPKRLLAFLISGSTRLHSCILCIRWWDSIWIRGASRWVPSPRDHWFAKRCSDEMFFNICELVYSCWSTFVVCNWAQWDVFFPRTIPMFFHLFWRWFRNAELELLAAKLFGYGWTTCLFFFLYFSWCYGSVGYSMLIYGRTVLRRRRPAICGQSRIPGLTVVSGWTHASLLSMITVRSPQLCANCHSQGARPRGRVRLHGAPVLPSWETRPTNPGSALLWGSEHWTLDASMVKRLTGPWVFFARSILGLSWVTISTNHLSHADLQNMLGDPSCLTLLQRRFASWIGHVVRMDLSRVPRQVLFGMLTFRQFVSATLTSTMAFLSITCSCMYCSRCLASTSASGFSQHMAANFGPPQSKHFVYFLKHTRPAGRQTCFATSEEGSCCQGGLSGPSLSSSWLYFREQEFSRFSTAPCWKACQSQNFFMRILWGGISTQGQSETDQTFEAARWQRWPWSTRSSWCPFCWTPPLCLHWWHMRYDIFGRFTSQQAPTGSMFGQTGRWGVHSGAGDSQDQISQIRLPWAGSSLFSVWFSSLIGTVRKPWKLRNFHPTLSYELSLPFIDEWRKFGCLGPRQWFAGLDLLTKIMYNQQAANGEGGLTAASKLRPHHQQCVQDIPPSPAPTGWPNTQRRFCLQHSATTASFRKRVSSCVTMPYRARVTRVQKIQESVTVHESHLPIQQLVCAKQFAIPLLQE